MFTKIATLSLALVSSSLAFANDEIDLNSDFSEGTSVQALEDIRMVTAWDDESTQVAAERLYRARKARAVAARAYDAARNRVVAEFLENDRFKAFVPGLEAAAWAATVSCYENNSLLTNPHNIGLFLVPEAIKTKCYKVGAAFLAQGK
jgi:hypothetical protein